MHIRGSRLSYFFNSYMIRSQYSPHPPIPGRGQWCIRDSWWRPRRADPEKLDRLTWQPPEEAGVWEQVAALPARERLILYLYYYQGYSTGEIAQLLGESPGTLRSHLSRARKALKLRLEAEGYGPS